MTMHRIYPARIPIVVSAIMVLAWGFAPRFIGGADSGVAVSVVTDEQPGRAVEHGLAKLTAALEAKGVAVERVVDADKARGKTLIVAGLAAGPGAAAQITKDLAIPTPTEPEALLIRGVKLNENRPVLVCTGADDRGLMYALLDVADRVGWAGDASDPLSEVRDAAEKPDLVDRALSIYTMQQKYFEQRLFDAKYWDRCFDMLARDRFNRFVIVFGYENGGYMAPMYPYYFDVPGFPDVKVTGLSKEMQKRYLDSLNRLIEQAHDRGIEVTLAPWDHIYRAGVQTGGVRGMDGTKPTPGLVWGVTKDNLKDFSVAALRELFKQVPNFDSIQFRMHGESGLTRAEMPAFWKAIYATVQECRPGIRFDARAKNFPDSLIDMALEMDVNIRITTKYWMEQMGLPFHPTHIHPGNQKDRRHGYADLLRYPQRYKMHWRLWNGGTTRILLWGDPEYARRFAESTHLYDGEGFEINEMLATKMEAQPHDMEPFELLNAKYRYCDYEFERYWHFYQVFGRLGYNPETPPEVWEKEFERRFGKEAGPHIMAALHKASKILPYAVAYCYPYNHFPTTRGWVARQRQGDLPEFARSLPSDTAQFLSPDEAARLHIAGEDSAKVSPHDSAWWFEGAAASIYQKIRYLQQRKEEQGNKELDSTIVDLRILAALASYHSRRIAAAYHYSLYKHSHDLGALREAWNHEMAASARWDDLIRAAGDVYHDDLMMGLRRSDLAGHWKDEAIALEEGIKKLDEEMDNYKPREGDLLPVIYHAPYENAAYAVWQMPRIRATAIGREGIRDVAVVYRREGGEYHRLPLKGPGPVYEGKFPYDVKDTVVEYYVQATDAAGTMVNFPVEGAGAPIRVKIFEDKEPPTVRHERVNRAPVLKPLKVAATVADPSGVKWVRLRYRPVTQFEDYRTLEMKRVGETDCYEATVPGEHIIAKYDFMYFIEVMDNAGNGAIHPDLQVETPYVVVKLER